MRGLRALGKVMEVCPAEGKFDCLEEARKKRTPSMFGVLITSTYLGCAVEIQASGAPKMMLLSGHLK